MSVRVHHDRASATAYVVLAGSVRWRHVASALLGLHGPQDTDPGLAVLWDARCVTEFDLPPRKVPGAVDLLEWLQGPDDGGRTAVLVRDEAAAFARFLVRCRQHSGRSYGVFTQMEEALAFLEEPTALAASTAETRGTETWDSMADEFAIEVEARGTEPEQREPDAFEMDTFEMDAFRLDVSELVAPRLSVSELIVPRLTVSELVAPELMASYLAKERAGLTAS